MLSTRFAGCSTTPDAAASSSKAFRTSRDRLEFGKSFPCASSCNGTPSEPNQAITSSGGKALKILRMIAGFPPEKSRSLTAAFVTLQRDPPLTRIFAPGFGEESRRPTEREGLRRRIKIAVARPAAPAPTTAMSNCRSLESGLTGRAASACSPARTTHPRPS